MLCYYTAMSRLGLESFVLGEMDTNCYLLWCEDTREAVIIDPADAGESIAEEVLARQLQPVAIVLTHGHFDHVLGSLALQLSFDIPIYLHPDDNFLLAKAQSSAEYWLKHPVDPVPEANLALADQQVIEFGNCALKVIHTPGHTPGSCCLMYAPEATVNDNEQFVFSEMPYLFDGDVIFKEGIGRTDFQYSKKNQLYKSFQIIKNLGVVRIFPGHGESFVSSDQEILG